MGYSYIHKTSHGLILNYVSLTYVFYAFLKMSLRNGSKRNFRSICQQQVLQNVK